jgi:hypothetical protein
MVSSIGRVRWTKALFSPVPHGPRWKAQQCFPMGTITQKKAITSLMT